MSKQGERSCVKMHTRKPLNITKALQNRIAPLRAITKRVTTLPRQRTQRKRTDIPLRRMKAQVRPTRKARNNAKQGGVAATLHVAR